MSSTLTLHVTIFLIALSVSLPQVQSDCKFAAEPEAHNNGGSPPNPKNESSSIKGMFVFGSSLVDTGNNNFLATIAKANYPPYGVDFALQGPLPSGRFTNGKNIIDLIGELLNLPPYLPPFFDPSTRGQKTANGVDFACGGSGIFDDTGLVVGGVMNLRMQISLFEEVTLRELELQLGCNSSEFLPRYLFIVGSGGNDYSLNFFRRNSTSPSLQEFTSNLTAALSLHLQRLYGLGGRKFVLMAVYPIGCNPSSRVSTPSGSGCDQTRNKAAELFNSNLRELVLHLTHTLSGSHFVLVDCYKIIHDILNDPLPKGFTVTETSCCEVPKLAVAGTDVLCLPNGTVCANRTNHVYFDGLHPTEALNIHLATKGFSSNQSSEAFPFNIQHLASL